MAGVERTLLVGADTVVGPYENNGSCGAAAKFVGKVGQFEPQESSGSAVGVGLQELVTLRDRVADRHDAAKSLVDCDVAVIVKGGAKLDQFGGGRIDQFWGRAAEQK